MEVLLLVSRCGDDAREVLVALVEHHREDHEE